MNVEALRQFILAQGPSKNVVNLDWAIIWATTSPRHTAVWEKDLAIAHINGIITRTSEDKPRHPKIPTLGPKTVYFGPTILLDQTDAATFSPGEEITGAMPSLQTSPGNNQL